MKNEMYYSIRFCRRFSQVKTKQRMVLLSPDRSYGGAAKRNLDRLLRLGFEIQWTPEELITFKPIKHAKKSSA